ncbi:hypothetical protein [uncultured Draconibacterium sp.]|uniref:hypothetical protein n=1 Tax=uncultured Draconibacterium sp. TaxID=1573823 RepID=UPI002AA8EF63|nr:hypothetical protein [uncultured Draconibacterium sp.]
MKLYLFLVLLIVFTSSCSEKLINEELAGTIFGTISGTEIFSDIDVDSIMVLLIDADFEPDTIEYNNKAAFVDTAYTDMDGSFIFTNVAEGNYYVYPMKLGYQFSGKNISIADVVEISCEDYIELKYTAGELAMGNSLLVVLNYVNCPESASVKFDLYRQEWLLFIPYWTRVHQERESLRGGMFVKNLLYGKGFTLAIFTRTNYFKSELLITESGNETAKTFEFGIDLSDPSVVIRYQYDWETDEITEF